MSKSFRRLVSCMVIITMMMSVGTNVLTANVYAEGTSINATNAITSGSEYIITSKLSNKAMEVSNGGQNNGDLIQQWDYVNVSHQQWVLEEVDNGYYKIINKESNRVVDVKDVATHNGATIHQWEYVGGDSQKWSIQQDGEGYYTIKSKHTGKVLDIAGISLNNGAKLQLWDDVNGDNQKWALTKISNNEEVSDFISGHTYKIISKQSNKSIEVSGAALHNGALVGQWDYGDADHQQWILEKVEGNYYKILSKKSNKVLDVKDVASHNGAAIHQWDYVGGNNQLWSFEKDQEGFYTIKSKHSGKVVDIQGVSAENGASLQLWDNVNGDNQKWVITEVIADENPNIVSGHSYKIISKHSNKAIEVSGGATHNGGVIGQWDYVDVDHQQWIFEKVEGEYYKIVAEHSGKVIDVKDLATNDGAIIHQWEFVGESNQLWSFEQDQEGYYKIKSKQSGKVLDIQGISTANGAKLQLWQDVNGDNQKWSIVDITDNTEESHDIDLSVSKASVGVDLAWTSSISEDNQYSIERKIDDSGFITIATNVSENSYTDLDIQKPGAYTYKVVQTLDSNITESNQTSIFIGGLAVENGDKDSDYDGLSDELEVIIGSDPLNMDTDGDGLFDGYEYYISLTSPIKQDTDDNGILDVNEDYDGDGLTTMDEKNSNTNPLDYDTDSDGLNDGDELNVYHTNTLIKDTDQDGMLDGDEIAYGTDPLNADTNGNGIKDGDEKYTSEATISDSSNSTVTPSVQLELLPEQFGTLSVVENDSGLFPNTMPGYLGNAYNFGVDGTFDSAIISFEFDASLLSDPEFYPAIYYYDEENQELVELPDQTINNGVVSVNVNHFSTYVLLNKTAFDKVWKDDIKQPNDGNVVKPMDMVLLIDVSYSMTWNDAQWLRKDVSRGFVEKLGENDRTGLITFRNIAEIKSSLTNNKSTLTSAINSMVNDSGNSSYSGTNGSAGIYSAINMLTSQNRDSNKSIIFLTDGEDTKVSYSYNELIASAQQNNITIYTIGLGSSIDSQLLNRIATSTGGKYYHATVAGDLKDIFEDATDETIDFSLDTDNDGIPDYYEKKSLEEKLLLFNGKSVQLDYQNPDTDGDGLKDGEEIKVTVNYRGQVQGMMISHPNLKDSDGDGYMDNVDLRPLFKFIVPTVLLHGRGDNTENTFGLQNVIRGKIEDAWFDTKPMNSNYGSSRSEKDQENDDYVYTSVNAQRILRVLKHTDYGPGGSAKLTPKYLGRELVDRGYKENGNLFTFNYANQDMVGLNANRLQSYLNNLAAEMTNLYNQKNYNDFNPLLFYPTDAAAKSGSYKVNLIGHSMGGLVSRYYIENLGQSNRVNSLITIDTPHWGSGLAEVSEGVLGSVTGMFIPCDVDLDPDGKIFGYSGYEAKESKKYNDKGNYAVMNQTSELTRVKGATKYYFIAGYDDFAPQHLPSGLQDRDVYFDVSLSSTSFASFRDSIANGFYNVYSQYRDSIIFDFTRVGGDNVVNNHSQFGIKFDSSGNKVVPSNGAWMNIDTHWGHNAAKHFHGQNQRRVPTVNKVYDYLAK